MCLRSTVTEGETHAHNRHSNRLADNAHLTNRQVDIQVDRHTDIQTYRHRDTEMQTDNRQTNIQIYRHADRQTDRYTHNEGVDTQNT